MPNFSADVLRSFAAQLFTAVDTPAAHAEIVADSLVGANLRGHDSHGVMRIASYIDNIRRGAIDPAATLTIDSETPGVVVGDGGWGLGQVVAGELTRRLLDKAAEIGVAFGTLRRAAHIGRLGEYAEMAAERGMCAMITANTHGAAQRVAPIGGKRPRLGTNPLCIGVPGGKEGPFVFDIGTSATAEGKVRVKRIAGEQVPPGLILDPDGRPTTDPNALYGDPPGTILPMGGDQAYKGFGLSMMIELLCGGLSGGQCAFASPPPPVGNCATFLIIDSARLAGTEHLLKEAGQLESYIRDCPRIDEAGKIILPGDPERAMLAARTDSGIPLDDGNWQALVRLAESLQVDVPAV